MGRLVRSVNFVSATGATELLDGVALNAAAASRTLTLDLKKQYSKLLVVVNLTRSAATDLSVTPSLSLDGVVYAQFVLNSAGTLTNYAPVKAVSGNDVIPFEFDVRGLESIKMVFAGTSGGGSDLIDVYVTGIAGF